MQVAPAIQKEKHRTKLSNKTNGQKFTWTKIARLNWAWSFKNLNLFAPRSGFTLILSGCWLICTHGYSLGCHKPTEKLLHAFFSWKQPLNQRQINVRAIRIAFKCCKYHQLPINNHIYSIRNWARSENTLTETDWETTHNSRNWLIPTFTTCLFWWLDIAKWNSLLSCCFLKHRTWTFTDLSATRKL